MDHMDDAQPENLIWVKACAAMSGVRYGEEFLVDGDDPAIQQMLGGDPPLLALIELPNDAVSGDEAAETGAPS